MKDLDLLNNDRKLIMPAPVYGTFLAAVERDTGFLSAAGLLDYSLILGFSEGSQKLEQGGSRRMSKEEDRSALSHAWVLPVEGQNGKPMVAYVGVIDILMEYSWFKRMETLLMTRLIGRDISCQPPPVYAKRFETFMKHISCVGPESSGYGPDDVYLKRSKGISLIAHHLFKAKAQKSIPNCNTIQHLNLFPI